MTTPTHPRAFNLMAEPAGAACNLNCAYCFYLEKAELYPEAPARMSDEALESYLSQIIEARQVPFVMRCAGVNIEQG